MLGSFLALMSAVLTGQPPDQEDASRLDRQARESATRSFDELFEFLAIPNDAHYPEDIKRNITWLDSAFRKRGFKTATIPTRGNALFFTELVTPDAKETVLYYLHLDGQPVDAPKWRQESPYTPVVKRRRPGGGWEQVDASLLKNKPDADLRIFARSASDDKSPIVMLLTAIDALKAQGKKPAYTLKVILDSEEEIGSPNLADAVQKNLDRLKADTMIVVDGPRHLSNEPTIYFGCRSISSFTLTVYGPRDPQHSGHYGNYAPNPGIRLARLLASMKDDDGRVTIDGFYDGIELDEGVRKILAAVPDDEEEIRAKLGFAEPDKVGASYQEALQYPSLNVRGLSSGWVGKEVRTIIPAKAVAEVDVRLVKESDPERLLALVKKHIETQGYFVTDKEPTEAERRAHSRIASFTTRIHSKAFRTKTTSTAGIKVSRAMARAFGKEPIRIRTIGGTLPLSHFVHALEIPAVIVPMANPDNNQHAPNENIRVGNYIDGVKTFIALLSEK